MMRRKRRSRKIQLFSKGRIEVTYAYLWQHNLKAKDERFSPSRDQKWGKNGIVNAGLFEA